MTIRLSSVTWSTRITFVLGKGCEAIDWLLGLFHASCGAVTQDNLKPKNSEPSSWSRTGRHLVDGDAVAVVHLVELVDAHHAAVRQHHRARLQLALACRGS